MDPLAGPNATLAIPSLITITYSPAVLDYTFAPTILRCLLLAWAHLVPTLLALSAASLISMLCVRIRALEAQCAETRQRLARYAAGPRQSRTQEALDALRDDVRSALDALRRECHADLDELTEKLDIELARVIDRVNMQRGMIYAVESNVEQARVLLAGGEDEGDESLRMGDDVETFWVHDAESEGSWENRELEEFIDLEAVRSGVERWLDRSWDVEEQQVWGEEEEE